MAQFLTPAWFEDVNDRRLSVAPELHVTVDQHIGGSGYRVTIAAGTLSVGPIDPASPPDAALVLDYSTAVELATGRLDAHRAFLAGQVKVSGNVTALAAVLPGISALGPALAAARDATRY